MKKQFPLLLTILGLLIGTTAQCQNAKGQTVIALDYGYNFVKPLVQVQFDNAIDDKTHSFDDATVQGPGPVILGIDYGIYKRFSMGLHFVTQGIKGRVTGYDYHDNNNVPVTEDFDYNLRRSHIGVLAKFHYLIEKDKLDLYSGIRTGYLIWSKTSESKDPHFESIFSDLNSRVTGGLLAFGAKYYFKENFGVNAELNIGRPYTIAIGFNYKFGGEK